MTTLYIDTSDQELIIVGLKIDGRRYLQKKKMGKKKRQVVLSIIENLLKKHKLESKDLNAIEVEKGPGSFTGLRVGVSIANALGFALKIPINGKKVGKQEEPIYN